MTEFQYDDKENFEYSNSNCIEVKCGICTNRVIHDIHNEKPTTHIFFTLKGGHKYVRCKECARKDAILELCKSVPDDKKILFAMIDGNLSIGVEI